MYYCGICMDVDFVEWCVDDCVEYCFFLIGGCVWFCLCVDDILCCFYVVCSVYLICLCMSGDGLLVWVCSVVMIVLCVVGESWFVFVCSVLLSLIVRLCS